MFKTITSCCLLALASSISIKSRLRATLETATKALGEVFFIENFPGGFGDGMTLYYSFDEDTSAFVYGYDFEGCYHGDFQIDNIFDHVNEVTGEVDLGGFQPESLDFVHILEAGSLLTPELRAGATQIHDLSETNGLFVESDCA